MLSPSAAASVSLQVQAQRSGLLTATVNVIAQGEAVATATAVGTPTVLDVERFSQFQGEIIHHRVATVEAMQLVLAARTTSIEAASRTEVSALRAELQTRNERTLEGQRGLSEQIIEQRGDVKAIRAAVERL